MMSYQERHQQLLQARQAFAHYLEKDANPTVTQYVGQRLGEIDAQLVVVREQLRTERNNQRRAKGWHVISTYTTGTKPVRR